MSSRFTHANMLTMAALPAGHVAAYEHDPFSRTKLIDIQRQRCQQADLHPTSSTHTRQQFNAGRFDLAESVERVWA